MRIEKVLILVSNLTSFYAIERDIQELRSRTIVDIVVIESYNDDIRIQVEDVIIASGYKTKTLEYARKNQYKILLEPYPLVMGIDAEFRIRYEYGVTPSYVKPNPVYSPDWNLLYDVVVCYSSIASNILSACTKPYIIKPSQFNRFKLHKKSEKLNLLVLFTWGDVSATKKLKKIKKQIGEYYNFIIKVHHGVEYLSSHEDAKNELKLVADEYYDASTNINTLFEKADVVLTDNSSAVFTAIYLGIPAAIFTEATEDYCSLNGIKAAHFSLLINPKRIPYTNAVDDVGKIIEAAIRDISKQNKLKDELYPEDIQETLVDVIETYMDLNRKQEPYYIIRDMLQEKRVISENTIKQQSAIIEGLKKENTILSRINKEMGDQITAQRGIKQSTKQLISKIRHKITRGRTLR